MPNSGAVAGRVIRVAVDTAADAAGSVVTLSLWSGNAEDTAYYYRLDPSAEPGGVTVDGEPADLRGLVAWLVGRDAKVTLWPDPERGGVAARARFRTCQPPPLAEPVE